MRTIIGLMLAGLTAGSAFAGTTCEEQRYEFIYKSGLMQDVGLAGAEVCREINFANGDRTYQKAKALADAGKPEQAEDAINKVIDATADYADHSNQFMCVRPSLRQSFQALMSQIAQQKADRAEKAGRLVEAINIHDNACQFAEAARIHIARVKAAPFQANGYSHGEDEFKEAWRYSKAHPFDSLKKTLREVATSRADRFQTIEAKMFAPTTYQPEALALELEWLPYTGDDGSRKQAVMSLAEQRGDALASKEGCNDLGTAVRYYEISGNKSKLKAAKAHAMRMSENFEKQGAYPAAARCYRVAGATNKADDLEQKADEAREQRAAEKQKGEKERKKKFSKEQDDLEKELGF